MRNKEQGKRKQNRVIFHTVAGLLTATKWSILLPFVVAKFCLRSHWTGASIKLVNCMIRLCSFIYFAYEIKKN